MFKIELREMSTIRAGDPKTALEVLLFSIGYLKEGKEPKSSFVVRESLPFRLFLFFLENCGRYFQAKELIEFLEFKGKRVTKPSLYRHLNKLVSMGIVEKRKEGKKVYYGMPFRLSRILETRIKRKVDEILRNMVETAEFIERRVLK